jgi:D-glycero-D-manno-heptose 1,7-bisphosphate phosphatase
LTAKSTITQAVILAGGLGTNLKPLTNNTPKPMVPVNGKPYLTYQLEHLKVQGIKRILLLTGYLAEQIEDYFKDGSAFGLSISYSREEQPLGTGGAIKKAEKHLEDRFLLINGDSFLPFDYVPFIEYFVSGQKMMQLCLLPQEYNTTGVKSNIAFDQATGLIKNYMKSGVSEDIKFVDAGVSTLKKETLSIFPDIDGLLSMEQNVYPILIKSKELSGFPITQRFYDIGNIDRLKTFEQFVLSRSI